jgi:hypothetical protein
MVTVGAVAAALVLGGDGALLSDVVAEVLLLLLEPNDGHQLGVMLVIEQPLTPNSRANTVAARTDKNRIRTSLSVGSGEFASASMRKRVAGLAAGLMDWMGSEVRIQAA